MLLIANALGVGLDELLQDQLNVGSRVLASELSEKLKKLPPEKQRRVPAILETVIAQI